MRMREWVDMGKGHWQPSGREKQKAQREDRMPYNIDATMSIKII